MIFWEKVFMDFQWKQWDFKKVHFVIKYVTVLVLLIFDAQDWVCTSNVFNLLPTILLYCCMNFAFVVLSIIDTEISHCQFITSLLPYSSCGFAEELEQEKGGGKTAVKAPTSSCGSVSLTRNVILLFWIACESLYPDKWPVKTHQENQEFNLRLI